MRGAGLIVTLMVVISAVSCGRREEALSMTVAKTPLDFRLGVDIGHDCDGCVVFTFEGIVKQQDSVLAHPEPDLVLGTDHIAGVTAWRAPDGFHIVVFANERGEKVLSALTEKRSDAELILVSVGEQPLGTFSPSLLKVSRGILGFSITREDLFLRLLDALGFDNSLVSERTDEQLLRECYRVAASDPIALERCRKNTWSEVAREKESLRKASKLLDSGRPEDREAAIETLLND